MTHEQDKRNKLKMHSTGQAIEVNDNFSSTKEDSIVSPQLYRFDERFNKSKPKFKQVEPKLLE